MECKYCDTGFPTNYEGDVICGGCGAEWADCAIRAEEEEDQCTIRPNCEGVEIMNWLDKYIVKNENGYLSNDCGGIFVSIDETYVRHVKGDKEPVNLKEISKDSFLEKLIN